MTKKEYLELIEKFANEQYGGEDSTNPPASAWIPGESDIKKKIQMPTNAGAADVTNVKKDQIMECLKKFRNLRVGKFILKISQYNNDPSGDFSKNTVTLFIYEEKNTTPSGMPGKMHYKLKLATDDRFENRPWLSHAVKHSEYLTAVPMSTVLDIIRWLQGITRLSAFT